MGYAPFDKEAQGVLDTISAIPGIDGLTLCDDLSKKFGRTSKQMRGVVSRLLDQGRIFHAAVTENGRMIYKYFPDATSRNRQYPDPKYHHKKAKLNPIGQHAPTMSEGVPIIKAVRATLTPEQRNAILDTPPPPPRQYVERPAQFTMADGEVYAVLPKHLYELYARLSAIFAQRPGL